MVTPAVHFGALQQLAAIADIEATAAAAKRSLSLKLVDAGAPIATVARAAGVTRPTIYAWRRS